MLLFVPYGRRYKVLEKVHASFIESVPFKSMVIFTVFEVVYFLVCYGMTWILVAGIIFHVSFFLLISIRQHTLPKIFQLHHLRELDAAEYEKIAGSPARVPSFSLRVSFHNSHLKQLIFDHH
ncbi:putative bicarbonate transporter [Helianthus annuus]|nr:putative bicarbonate transporter [Helianthus annuus]KAJ0711484.1 putative bicarbonate transporter [Helianthus annuus]